MNSAELSKADTGDEFNELDIQPSTNAGLRELALFAGGGGGILAGHLLGWRTVCAVERNAYAAQILAARQNDRTLEPFPIWSDIETFDGKPWRGRVDVVSGGFPCQDISVAGKGEGITGARSGMWKEMARVIREVRPRFVYVENSPALTSRGLGTVLGDLAEIGFDAKWGVLGADDLGAWHERKRIWIFAHANSSSIRQQSKPTGGESSRESANDGEEFADAVRARLSNRKPEKQDGAHRIETGGESTDGGWWSTEPGVVRVVHGLPYRLDRIVALGNAQVPAVARSAWETLSND